MTEEFVRPMRLDIEGIGREIQKQLLETGKFVPLEPFVAMVLKKSKRKMTNAEFFNLISGILDDMVVDLKPKGVDSDIVAQKSVEGTWNA